MPSWAENTAENTTPERSAAPPTHAVYTPVWDEEGRSFRTWLKLGAAWCGPTDKPFMYMSSMPIEPERSFTGYLRLVPVGQKPPAPLTMSQEFVEDMLTNDLLPPPTLCATAKSPASSNM